MHPTGFNCTSMYPSFGIQVQYYVGLSAQKCTNCSQIAHVHYQQLHNQSCCKSFKFSALPPPSTSPPAAPWSSYELAGGPTLKVSRSINKPDQALIRPMRHWGQPLRWNLWAGFFTSPSAFLSFWTVFGRPGALACKGGVLLVREGLGFLKFRCTCHLLLFLLPAICSDRVVT